MSRFIRLTDFFGNPVYVNVNMIESVSAYRFCGETDGSVIVVGGNFTHVKESLDEVCRMMREAEDAMRRWSDG